ncbi:MAG: phage tail sheath family protein [Terriglobales bacterium]
MPITPTYPGVYIEEVPSGVHTITGVATSITAFVGRAKWGSVNEPIVVNSFADFERQFGGLWPESTMSYAVQDFFLNGGGTAIIVRLTNGASAARLELPQDSVSSPPSSPLSSSFASLVLNAASAGSWGASLTAVVDHKTANPSDTTLFNLSVTLMDATGKKTVASEKYLNLSVDPKSARYVAKYLQHNSALALVEADSSGNDEVPGVRPADTTVTILSPPQTVPLAKPFEGGGDGGAISNNDVVGNAAGKEGLYALDKADLFNLLCIPPYSGDDVDNTVIPKAAKYCHDRRAFYIVDPPSAWNTKAKAVAGIAAGDLGVPGGDDVATSSAVFFPRILEADLLREGQIETFVPCGAVAGVFARTDAQRGVWKAPAGQEAGLVGVVDLAVNLTDPENGELNPLGVNCLRSFPLIGPVVWGARTVQGADQLASEWKYIPVRRTALYIEESLYRGTKWVVFEPNDESLWMQIRLNVGAFMHDLFRQGAFQGKSVREAYFVKCDSDTTIQNDIDHGIVNIVVGFAPLKPAEFVVIRIQQIAGQVQV